MGSSSYVYDGDGERVRKDDASTGTLYWRGASGDPLVESDLAGNPVAEYIFFAGRRVARRDLADNSVHFYFSDELGSHAVVTDESGACEQDIDFYPYGGKVADYCPRLAQHYLFTGKERDEETGLDYFGARYYSSALGRFMTPDWSASASPVPYANFSDPQTINQYAYVRNNPLFMADVDGHAGDASQNKGGDPVVHPTEAQGGATAPAAAEVNQKLDGKLHVTENADGTKTSYQGTISETTNKDKNGNVLSTTTTSTVTTQTLNAHGDIEQTTTTTMSITRDTNGTIMGTSETKANLSDNSAQAQSMRDGALSWYQKSIGTYIDFKVFGLKISDHLKSTPSDVLHTIQKAVHCEGESKDCPD